MATFSTGTATACYASLCNATSNPATVRLTSMFGLSSEAGGELQSGPSGGPAVLQPAGVERKHY